MFSHDGAGNAGNAKSGRKPRWSGAFLPLACLPEPFGQGGPGRLYAMPPVSAAMSTYMPPHPAMTAMGLALKRRSRSSAAAIVGNIARTCVAVLWMEAPSLFVQLPVVCAFSIVAGGIVGILTILSIKHLPERLTMFE